ncbi:hypothetical protein FGB62_169g34 [Gracilaria domingensis]|nr:hypothetical protein FGB62_169g34 [Gracilaria domingensis]
MAPSKRPKLTNDSAAVRCLHQMFDSGDLTGDENASDVKKMDSLFEPFLLPTFRNRFNKIRDEKKNELSKYEFISAYIMVQNVFRSSGFEDRHTSTMSPRCSGVLSNANNSKTVADDNEVEQVDNVGQLESEGNIARSRRQLSEFYPLVLQFLFCYVCVTKSDLCSQVVNPGMIFELVIDWPEVMTNPKALFKGDLEKQFHALMSYHPKMGGFHRAMRELREKESDKVKSFCHIDLPFAVETDVRQKKVLNFGEGLRVLYVELRAPDNKYVDTDDIEEVIVM